MLRITFLALSIFTLTLAATSAPAAANEREAARYMDKVRGEPAFLRAFLAEFPKGSDLHNHLTGAVYAERMLKWAAEDGLCIDTVRDAIVTPDPGKSCKAMNLADASTVAADSAATDELIDSLSMRSYTPSPGWSGHDQFFATFFKMSSDPKRFGDALADVSARAGRQNEVYLELMQSININELYSYALQNPWSGDIPTMYKELMGGPLGNHWDKVVADSERQITEGEKRRRERLKCETDAPDPGCDVEIRYLYQVIRTGPLSGTFAGFMLGFELAREDPRVVGINLVAPEDDPTAIRNYTLNMEMIDFLWQQKGPINVSLHAGELTLGLVPPSDLKFHIWQAIDIGHAKRIGHGIDINYERDMPKLLSKMQREDIMVEINLTSNDVILGVKGKDHPFNLYRSAGVPVALSTDDEGVSRIDLTHEYQRAVETYDLSYQELKALSYNSLDYSFLSAADKEKARASLDARFEKFESSVGKWPRPKY